MKKISRTIVLMLLVVSVLMTSAITVFATTEKTSLLGDADLDGRVSICDATAIQKHVAQLKELSDDGILTGDVDNNGRVDIRDATSIQKHLVKLDCSYPIGEPVKPNEEETLPTVPDTENPTTPTEPDNNTPVTPDEENYRPIDPDTTDILTEQMLWEIEQEFYRLVNEERIWKGLEPLSYNQHLDDIAQIRSLEITELYSHTRPNGESFSSIIDLDKYNYSCVGENICYFYHINGTVSLDELVFTGSREQIENAAKIVFNAFKNSPGHYANMTHKDFKNAGIGISYVWDEDLDIPCFYLSHNFGAKMK